MSQAKDESSQSPPEGINEDEAKGFHIPGGPGINHIAHNHVDSTLCNLVTPSLSRSPLKQPDTDTFVVELGLDFEDTASDEYCGNRSSSEVSGCLKNGSRCFGGYYDDSEEDRPGSFDYMPSQSGHVRITNTFNPQYDDDVKLDSSIGSSTVESPRSEDDTRSTQDDCGVAEKEDTSVSKETCSPHSKHKHPCWDYMPGGKRSDDEDMEDEEDERDRKRGMGTTSSSFMSSFPRTVRQVDECVSYNLKPLNGPGTGHSCQEFMPHLYSSYHDPTTSEGSKKDKKKSWSKDDSDKPDVSGQVDINGNPRQLDADSYLQMLQWPRGKSPSSSPATQSGHTSIAVPPSANSSGGDPNAFDRMKERRRMKLERLKGTPAEAYKGHRKFSDIEEILDFVEGPNTSSKSENKSAKKKQERSRKKDHHINGPFTLEDSAEGEDTSRQEEPSVVTAEAKLAERAMGNSFRRAVGENSITQSWSEDDIDKNIDFHDCLNTVPVELVTSQTEFVTSELTISNREQHQQSTDTSGNNIKSAISSTLTHQTDSLSSWDSNTEKHSTDNSKTVTKKSTKTKSKREKQDATDISGPLSPKFNINMVKPKVTVKDSSLVTSLINSGSVKVNNSMDKESHPDVKREDSFTEVKKKKKRLVGKDSHAAVRNKFVSSSYHPHINNIHPHHSNQRPRTSTPPSPPVVSSIAASLTSSTSWPSSNQTHSPRDLSPSAFPVLSSQGPPLTFHAEARRNSCGDLNSESVDSKIYDSDRESAKSLPAAHGARVGGELSPIYPVSYARMAAVLPKNDSSNSPNSESGVASISRNSSINSSIIQTVGSIDESVLPPAHSNAVATPERKATVWKGSPRERRHSIGSSPEDIVDGEKSSVAERNRQCGSQEVLSRSIVTSVNVASKDGLASSSPVRLTPNSSSFYSSTDTQQTIISPLVKCISNQMKNPVSSSPHVTKLQNAEQKTTSQSTEYATIISTSSQAGPTSAAFRPGTVPSFSQSSVTSSGAQENIDEHNSRITKTCAQTCKQSGTLPMADNSSKSAFNKNKLSAAPDSARRTSSLKSVIFMDKRFDSLSSANLGITFGFDSSYESKCEPASQPSNQHQQQLLPSQPPPSSAPPSSSSPNSSRNTSAQTSLQCPAVTQEHPHIPSKAQIAASLPNPPPSNSSPSTFGDDNNSHVPKGPHIRGPCNGLILPSSPSGNYSIPQNQAASCGKSVSSSIDNNQDLTASQRTSLSGGKPVDSVNLNVNSVRNSDTLLSFGSDSPVLSRSDPLVPTRLPSPTAITLTDNPLSRVNESKKDTVLGKSDDFVAQNDSAGVTFTATSSPPLSQTVATEDRDNIDCSTVSLPSPQDNKEDSPASQYSPQLVESILRESTTSPSTNLEESKDTLEAPVPSSIAVTPSPTTEAASQEPPPTHSAILDMSKPVVYGLKIRPSVGCGKLLFVPSNTTKKSRGNSSEISTFLTKRWFEGVIKPMGSGAFVTLDEA